MHPILRNRARLALYLGGWLMLAALIALVVAAPDLGRWADACLLLAPVLLLYSFVCLAAWYPCRANSIAGTSPLRVLTVHGAGALVGSGLLQGAAWTWARTLDRLRPQADAALLHRENLPLFFAIGVLLYLLAVAVHYLMLAFEASRRAESRALELKLLAQQAELAAFKAQIDPHFLFNSLNSISSLCGSDPAAARAAAIRLGEFLRSSLKLGSAETIPLSEELRLAAAYLQVERARYGNRLIYEERIDPECRARPVPPLILQPLLENSLKHGIAHLTEPGTVSIRALLYGNRLHLSVESSCDPERPRTPGTGIGLKNIRGRLNLLHGSKARLTVRDLGNTYRVEIVLPEEDNERAAGQTGPHRQERTRDE